MWEIFMWAVLMFLGIVFALCTFGEVILLFFERTVGHFFGLFFFGIFAVAMFLLANNLLS